MTEPIPFIGEIRMFGGNFAPRGWALCNGQLLQVSQNDALFSLLGTIYGGDGRRTFGLPDLRGRIPIHMGDDPGLSRYKIGQKGGVETVSLTVNEIPSHNHELQATTDATTSSSGNGTVLARSDALQPYESDRPDATLDNSAINNSSGTGAAHNNMMPFQVVNYIIALVGAYPPRQ
ncbi:MAG: tail fiber protein [Chloroflexota bacterium]